MANDERKERRSDKRPSFQFYPMDWLEDEALKLCSLEAQGLWIRMVCHMHIGRPYGQLNTPQGVRIRDIDLWKLTGATPKKAIRILRELELYKVFSRLEDGTIYSRRMIHDQSVREILRSNGLKGGRPKSEPEANQNGNQNPNQKEGSSSSSSSSSSLQKATASLENQNSEPKAGELAPNGLPWEEDVSWCSSCQQPYAPGETFDNHSCVRALKKARQI